MWSQTPVIWQKITQMGQTEPAEPTGSWEWWCTGCFLSTGCTLAQKLHTLTHQTEPLKEGRQRDQRGQEIGEGAARSRRGMSIFRTEWRTEVENERRKRGEVVLKASQKKLLCKKMHEKRRISFVVTFKDLWSKVKETWRIKCARRQKETVFG